MQKLLNFTIVLKSPDDQKWGTLESDGKTWNGMISELLDDKIDICTSGLSITYDRAKVSDFRYICNECRSAGVQGDLEAKFVCFTKVEPATQSQHNIFISFAAYQYSMEQKPFWDTSRMAHRSIGLFMLKYSLPLYGPCA